MTKPEDTNMHEQASSAADQAQPADTTEQAAQSERSEPESNTQVLQERIGELETQLAAVREEAGQRQEAALRAAAEAENVRRRAAQDVQKARDFALEKFASELLPVVDNLERTLQALEQSDGSSAGVAEGIEMTYQGFISTLNKFGMVQLDPQGQVFNPEHHQAMGMQESESHAPNTVLAVMQKGYTLNERLLRPAMVMVARAPSAGVDTTA